MLCKLPHFLIYPAQCQVAVLHPDYCHLFNDPPPHRPLKLFAIEQVWAEMKIGDEIRVQEVDLENGENGGDNVPYGILGPVIHGIPLQDLGALDPPNNEDLPATLTEDGLPIQQYKAPNRMFLRRQVQMMAISITNSIQSSAESCRLLHRNNGFLLYWKRSTASGPYLIASCFHIHGDGRL